MENKRLLSIDTLRGMDMVFIMGLAPLIVSICELFPGGGGSFPATQMHHVPWNGLTLMDTVFPLFLYIAGLSFPFSLAKQVSRGRSSWEIHRKIFVRALILIALGIVYNGFFRLSFPQRYASVLGRIGLAWMIAALLYIHLRTVPRIIVAAAILLGYWLVVALIPAPDAPAGAGPLTQDGCINGYIDRLLLPGRLHNGNFDPEGLLSTLPAAVTAMLGMFTGEFIRKPEVSGKGKTVRMLAAAAALLLAGLLWSTVFPVNKKLWTSSFVLVTGGIFLAAYALVYYIVEVKERTRWTLFFRVIGLNSITIYMLQRIVPLEEVSAFFLSGAADLLPGGWGQVLLSAGYLAVSWLLLYFLYRKGVFLKLHPGPADFAFPKE